MKIVITGNDHSVDVEVSDEVPELDVNELMAMARDLYRETRSTRKSIGFERATDG